MPKSPLAPEPPPEPTQSEIMQKEVAKIKRLLGLDVNRLALGSEVEGIIEGGPFGSTDFTIRGVNTISFVNVSTSLGPSQGGSPPPPQVTGLTTNVISNTQINLSWTAYGGSDFNFYTVYRGTSPGFSADSSSDIATPTTNSYNNTGLTAGTAYYYRVATTNDANLEGPLSVEVSGTTTGGGDVTPPGQVTGLAANVISNTQINLTWTASTAGDLNHYDVHRSTTTGFTPAVGNRIAQPTTNSYNNTGLAASTTYYYKVGAVDNANNIGTYSTQVSATTTSAAAIIPNVLLHFDNNLTDSGSGAQAWGGGNPSGFSTGSAFGTHAVNINTTGTPPVDFIRCTAGNNVNIQMNTTVGFSISLWIYPTDISALDERRIIVEHYRDANNKWTLQLSSGGTVYFFVQKGGTDYKTQKGGFVINTWQHIGATFNAATNTVTLYKDGSAGGVSTQPTQYPTDTNSSLNFSFRWNESLNHYYEGRIDEFQFFNGTVLSSTQITDLKDTNATS